MLGFRLPMRLTLAAKAATTPANSRLPGYTGCAYVTPFFSEIV